MEPQPFKVKNPISTSEAEVNAMQAQQRIYVMLIKTLSNELAVLQTTGVSNSDMKETLSVSNSDTPRH
jgi:hypothetical protein